MLTTRIIPCLLLKDGGLVKTVRFKNPRYVGDPINAIKIFNEKEVDELVFFDISATTEGRKPPFEIIGKIASECFMPVCYGGGVRNVDDMRRIFGLGIEKISMGSCAVTNPALVMKAADIFGNQSVVVCIDVIRGTSGKCEVVIDGGRRRTGVDPVDHAIAMEKTGAGEIIVNSVDRDGTMSGYDLELVRSVVRSVGVPVVACGGAGKLDDMRDVINLANAASAAAGSLFIYHGKHRAVLISYPDQAGLANVFSQREGNHE